MRIIPRYRRLDHRRGKRLIGLRLCVHWRVHGETVCEMDLQGSVADTIVHDHDGFSYALLVHLSRSEFRAFTLWTFLDLPIQQRPDVR